MINYNKPFYKAEMKTMKFNERLRKYNIDTKDYLNGCKMLDCMIQDGLYTFKNEWSQDENVVIQLAQHYNTSLECNSIQELYEFVMFECESLYGSAHELDSCKGINIEEILWFNYIVSSPDDKAGIIFEWFYNRGYYACKGLDQIIFVDLDKIDGLNR